MESVTPFAQMPTTPEPIIAQVRRQLANDVRLDMHVQSGILDRVADRAVRELWGSRVKTFVPVLALRQAREVLGAQQAGSTAQRPEMGSTVGSAPAPRPQAERPPRDVLHIPDDVLPLNERDVMPM
jgi:hypothetical protein